MSCDILLADITTANPNIMSELSVSGTRPTAVPRCSCARAAVRRLSMSGTLPTILYTPSRTLRGPKRCARASPKRCARRRAGPKEVLSTSSSRRCTSNFQPICWPKTSRPARTATSEADVDAVALEVARATARRREEGRGNVRRPATRPRPRTWICCARTATRATADGLIRAPTRCRWRSRRSAGPAALGPRAEPSFGGGRSGSGRRADPKARRRDGQRRRDLGILGRIYKERWKSGANPTDLREAIDGYRRGFALKPTDYYTGFNAVSLLFIQNDPAADKEVASLLPEVKAALQEQLTPDTAELLGAQRRRRNGPSSSAIGSKSRTF